MMNFVMLFLGLALSCSQNEQAKETFTFIIDKPNEGKQISIKLKKTFYMQAMEILENSLDDTCMIGIMKIPPGKTGRLYKIEFLGDSLKYMYRPFKAVKGKLVFKHSFLDY